MTSIHASIPAELRAAAKEARGRGDSTAEPCQDIASEDGLSRQKSATTSGAIMKRLPQCLVIPQTMPALQSDASPQTGTDEEDESTASKENDPSLSPHPKPTESSRRSNHPKRPLSDLPCPLEEEYGEFSPSQQNIINNGAKASSAADVPKPLPGSQLMEKNQLVNFASRNSRDSESSTSSGMINTTERPAKRICSDDTKENSGEDLVLPSIKKSSRSGHGAQKSASNPRKASALAAIGGSSVKPGKARVGLRRL